jgi:hypothetical protein
MDLLELDAMLQLSLKRRTALENGTRAEPALTKPLRDPLLRGLRKSLFEQGSHACTELIRERRCFLQFRIPSQKVRLGGLLAH